MKIRQQGQLGDLRSFTSKTQLSLELSCPDVNVWMCITQLYQRESNSHSARITQKSKTSMGVNWEGKMFSVGSWRAPGSDPKTQEKNTGNISHPTAPLSLFSVTKPGISGRYWARMDPSRSARHLLPKYMTIPNFSLQEQEVHDGDTESIPKTAEWKPWGYPE